MVFSNPESSYPWYNWSKQAGLLKEEHEEVRPKRVRHTPAGLKQAASCEFKNYTKLGLSATTASL